MYEWIFLPELKILIHVWTMKVVVEIKVMMNEHFVIEETLELLEYLRLYLILMMKELKEKILEKIKK
jgi:hypothetical protein